MDKSFISQRSFSILSGMSGVFGVVLLIVSFAINNGPPPGATSAELVEFCQQHYAAVLWGAWLQTVGSGSNRTLCYSSCSLGRSGAALYRLDDPVGSHCPDDGKSHRDHILHQRFVS